MSTGQASLWRPLLDYYLLSGIRYGGEVGIKGDVSASSGNLVLSALFSSSLALTLSENYTHAQTQLCCHSLSCRNAYMHTVHTRLLTSDKTYINTMCTHIHGGIKGRGTLSEPHSEMSWWQTRLTKQMQSFLHHRLENKAFLSSPSDYMLLFILG